MGENRSTECKRTINELATLQNSFKRIADDGLPKGM